MIGFVNVFKPSGESSSRTVQFVKRVLINNLGEDKKIKVGHFGTLDPNASGVLPIAIGTACRLFDLTLDKIKVYKAELIFGKTTDTLDTCGQVLNEVDVDLSLDDLRNAIENFPKEYDQTPPKVSAKSIGGVRAYQLARRGIEFELQTKKVKIYNLELIEKLEKNKFLIRVECSAGTYIRSLCRDIGEMLDTPAIMGELLREKSGEFDLSSAVEKDEFAQNPEKYILPIDIVLKNKKRYVFEGKELEKLKNGVRLPIREGIDEGLIVDKSGKIYGLGKKIEEEFGFYIRLQ